MVQPSSGQLQTHDVLDVAERLVGDRGDALKAQSLIELPGLEVVGGEEQQPASSCRENLKPALPVNVSAVWMK